MLHHLHSLDAILAPLYFGIFAAVAVVCGLGLILCRHPINGAINLIGTMVALSGIYALLDSPFLAVLQVLVYAGAIMMLVVFVIMVLNQARDHVVPGLGLGSLLPLAVPVALGAVLVWSVESLQPIARDPKAARGTVDAVAATMFDMTTGGWWLLFELTGVLLLAAAVAAVLLAKRSLDAPAEDAPATGHEGGHH